MEPHVRDFGEAGGQKWFGADLVMLDQGRLAKFLISEHVKEKSAMGADILSSTCSGRKAR